MHTQQNFIRTWDLCNHVLEKYANQLQTEIKTCFKGKFGMCMTYNLFCWK